MKDTVEAARRIIDEAERDAENGGMADQAFWPETAVQVARALLTATAEREKLAKALHEAVDYVADSIAHWPVGTLENEVASAVWIRCQAALTTPDTQEK